MDSAIKRRENTFRIDYAGVPKKPSYEELHHFVGTILGLKREEIERIQCSRNLGCAFVKTNDLSVAQKVVEEHNGKHQMEVDGKLYNLRILLEDGTVEVKLYDLSEDVTNEQIAEALCEYGDVLSIREILWGDQYLFKGIPTGVRAVKMAVKRNIASYITIDGETTYVSYYGQRQTCRHCSEFAHNGISCVQNKKLLVQKSYANVAKQPSSIPQAPKPTGSKPPALKPLVTKPFGQKPPKPKPPRPAAEPMTATNTAGERECQTSELEPPILVSSTPSDPVFKPPDQPTVGKAKKMFKPALSKKKDGQESDTSSTSTNSRELRAHKKMRHDDSDDSLHEEIRL